MLIIRAGKWWVISFTIIAFSIAIYNSYTSVPIYTAETTVMINSKNPELQALNYGGRGAMLAGSQYNLATELALLKSRSMAEKIIEALWNSEHRNDLYLFGTRVYQSKGIKIRNKLIKRIIPDRFYRNEETARKYSQPYSERIGAMFSGQVLNILRLDQISGTKIVTISMSSNGRDEAILLANTVAHVYQQQDKEMGSRRVQVLKGFITEQLKSKEKELEKSEKDLQDFQTKELIFSGDVQSNLLLSQSIDFETQYQSTNIEINIAERQRDYLTEEMDQETRALLSTLTNTINERLLSLRAALGKKEAELIQNESLYGPDHELVRSTRSQIEKLRKNLEEETKTLIADGVQAVDPFHQSQYLFQQLLSLEAKIAGLRAKVQEYQSLMKRSNSQLEKLPQKQMQFAKLERDRQVLNSTYIFMRQKMEETQISEASNPGRVQIIDPAIRGGKVSPDIPRNLTMSLIIGLGLGIGFTLLRHYFDNSIRHPEDIERFGVSLLGVVPRIIGKKYADNHKKNHSNRSGEHLNDSDEKNSSDVGNYKQVSGKELWEPVTHRDPKSPISEAFRSVRTNVIFSSVDKEIHSILITSPGPREGKTTIAANLSVTFADMDKRTLIIDADLRKPRLHTVFKTERNPGLTHYLIGEEPNFDNLIYQTTVKNLLFVPAGIIPPNPSAILYTQ